MKCPMSGTMFIVNFMAPPELPTALTTQSLNHPADFETWHQRLAHVGESTINEMIRDGTVEGLSVTKKSVIGRCEDCIMGKQTRHPFDADVLVETVPFERVGSSTCPDHRWKDTDGGSD